MLKGRNTVCIDKVTVTGIITSLTDIKFGYSFDSKKTLVHKEASVSSNDTL